MTPTGSAFAADAEATKTGIDHGSVAPLRGAPLCRSDCIKPWTAVQAPRTVEVIRGLAQGERLGPKSDGWRIAAMRG